MKKISRFVMAAFYILAGCNHFYKPEGYYRIIPAYLGNAELINIGSGMLEILFGILVLVPATRRVACYAIIVLLVAFVPAHIYMIRAGFCIQSFCLPAWILWTRLLVVQPLLIVWAWKNR